MGGPGEKSIEEMLEKLRERIRRGERVIEETKIFIEESLKKLWNDFASLVAGG
jgi:argininosuccinate lyase